MRSSWLCILLLLVLCLIGCRQDPPAKERFRKETNGTFVSLPGEEGEIGFGETFVGSPNVDLFVIVEVKKTPVKHTIIVEVKPDKFKWKNTAKKGDPDATEQVRWIAVGQIEK